MATNNGGNNNDQGSNPYARHNSVDPTAAVAIIFSVFFTAVLVRLIYFLLRLRKERGADGTRGPSAGAGAPPRVRQPPAAVTVELQAGPLVCTYRRADGWREATCPVCLSDFADGEVVRVLPACMHSFHAACVDEWLRARTTCPLCRAAPAATA